MKKFLLLAPAMILSVTIASAQSQPASHVRDLLIQAELDPSNFRHAKQLAIDLELPISIQLPSGIMMFPVGIEQNKPVYAVLTNPLHPFEDCSAAFYEDIERTFDLSNAKKIFAANEAMPQAHPRSRTANTNLLLVPDWTADRVWAFDVTTGNLVDTAFIHSNSTALASPKQALEHPLHKFVSVSDQITDLVQKFNPQDGTWISWFAPSGGVNNAILDNIRGHAYRPNNNLLVTVASGSNTNSIAEFDTAGNYVGNFIGQAVGGLNGPFDILFRESDILITQSSAPQGVKQYDLNGAYLSQWATITSFPQQMFRMSDGRIAVANFSGTGSTGIRIYDANGNFLKLLAGVTGNRGVYQLPSGNFLTTNGAGIHEIDSTTGNLVRTIQPGTNFQYINLYAPVTVGVDEGGLTIPAKYALEQNHPNPFNPTTTIRFNLPTESNVTLKIYNILGQELAALVQGVHSPGFLSTEWNGKNQFGHQVASGVYFYRIEAKPVNGSTPFVSLKKMILLK